MQLNIFQNFLCINFGLHLVQAPVSDPLQTFHTLATREGSFLKWPDIAESML